MGSGFLALVLHAHLPFVRHPEHEDFLEEDWLFEAITESYLPLIAMMQRLVRDEVPFKLTMTVTPTLCAMLGDELLRARYVRYLDRALELAAREMERNKDDAHLRALGEFYHANFSGCRHRFVEEWNLMGKARNLDEFRKALDMQALPMFNICYADKEGNGGDPRLATVASAISRSGARAGSRRLRRVPRIVRRRSGWLLASGMRLQSRSR